MSASQTGPSLLDFDFVYFRVISNKELLSNPNSDSLQRSKKAGEGLFTSTRSDRTRGNGLHLTAQSSGHLLEGGVHAPGQAEGERGERAAPWAPGVWGAPPPPHGPPGVWGAPPPSHGTHGPLHDWGAPPSPHRPHGTQG